MKLVHIGTATTYTVLILADGRQFIFSRSAPIAVYTPPKGKVEALWRTSASATRRETTQCLRRYIGYFPKVAVQVVEQDRIELLVGEL